MDLNRLSQPFPAEDVEWRVSRAGNGKKGIFCCVIAYITARAIQARLDEVCGPENWRIEEPEAVEFSPAKFAFKCGISIYFADRDEWITKWDVSEPTNIEAAKGGFSGAMKRAGSQWGIGRYLYHLEETFAEVSDSGGKGWNYAKLPEKQGGSTYYWKAPSLPGWALPKEPEHEVSQRELNILKKEWKDKFASESSDSTLLLEGFSRFVTSTVGEFPLSDNTCWTRDKWNLCREKIGNATGVDGVSSDVPFD